MAPPGHDFGRSSGPTDLGNTALNDPEATRSLQTNIFVDPADHADLQNVASDDPDAPQSLRTNVFLGPAGPTDLQNTGLSFQRPPGDDVA